MKEIALYAVIIFRFIIGCTDFYGKKWGYKLKCMSNKSGIRWRSDYRRNTTKKFIMKCLLIALETNFKDETIKRTKRKKISTTNLCIVFSKCFDMFAMSNIVILRLIKNSSNCFLHSHDSQYNFRKVEEWINIRWWTVEFNSYFEQRL